MWFQKVLNIKIIYFPYKICRFYQISVASRGRNSRFIVSNSNISFLEVVIDFVLEWRAIFCKKLINFLSYLMTYYLLCNIEIVRYLITQYWVWFNSSLWKITAFCRWFKYLSEFALSHSHEFFCEVLELMIQES